MFNGSPYSLEPDAAKALLSKLNELSDRVGLLRSTGKLSEATLKLYYGEKRFEQIAESNGIEGSTLSVGETQLAILKGMTITGHDPKHSDAARSLAVALDAINEMARDPAPTGLLHVREIHRLVLGGHPQAGAFRMEEVRISGATHIPPRTGLEIQAAMQDWADWAKANPSAHPVLRAAVLHAWLAHVHPFVDGNGRTARALTTLELVRAGYPPLLIKKIKHRDRYIDALATSDESGNLGPFLDLIIEREEDSLRDLERAAATGQDYDAARERLRRKQSGKLQVWNAALELLAARVEADLKQYVDAVGGEVTVRRFRDSLTLDDYLQLCNYEGIRDAWAFRIDLTLPAMPGVTRLAWLGFRSDEMRRNLPRDAAPEPSIFWSMPNEVRYPPWVKAYPKQTPRLEEITLVGDTWIALSGGKALRMNSVDAALAITRGFEELVG
jgi:Fic family protein